MLKKMSACLLGMSMGVVGVAQADGFALGAHAGLLGGGFDGFYRLTDTLVLRGSYNQLGLKYSTSEDELDYDAKFKFDNALLGLDWYPFSGSFRLSAAYTMNKNNLTLTAKPNSSGTFELDGTTYLASELGNMRVKLDYPSSAPYLGFGWGNPVYAGKGLGMTFDIGVVMTGSADVGLNINCGPAIAGTPRCDQLKASAEAERKTVEDDIGDLKLWPLVQLGLTYQF